MSDPHRISILIVDDEPDMLRGLRRILKVRGFDVDTAGSGEEAVERVREREPDGILMDIRMPGIDGVEAFRQIRSIAPNVFVIFMTAFSKLVDEAHDEGPIDVLSKPVELDEVCTLIEHASVTRPVLVVDDEPDFLQSLIRALKTQGFEIHSAPDMQQAIAIFEKRPRALVLLDMKLGQDSGLDVLREVRTRNPNVLVIPMTGHPELQAALEQELPSVCASLTKPFDIDDLVATLHRCMRQTSTRS